MGKGHRIYINGRFLTQRMTGVERFAYNICRALCEMGQPFTLICPKAPVQDCYDTRGMDVVHYGRGNSHIWEQLVLPFYFIGKRDYTLCSFTGLGSVMVCHKIMTIHDLSFLENPRWFSRAYYLWYKMMTPLAARTSRAILTVSDFSRREIRRFYPFLKEEKIHVVYSAVDAEKFSLSSPVTPPPERFALTVSSLDPRKNFSRLIEAFKGIEGCRLYIVGHANRVFGQGTGIDTESDHVRFLGRVSDEELVRLYHQADCFIFPSIYEGFGLPPLEAMQCGCPVLASDIPVLHEVCADAALYFNPTDVGSIHDTILHFQGHIDELRPRLMERGRTNAQRFSWRKTAEKTVEVIKGS